MKKSLLSKLGLATLAISAACSTNPRVLRTPDHIRDIEVTSVSSERDANYALTTMNIDGLGEVAFYKSQAIKDDEANFVAKPYKGGPGGSRIRINLEDQTARLNPVRQYTPVKFVNPETGRISTRYDLDMVGDYGVRATNQAGKVERVQGVGTRTQKHLDFDLKPLDIRYLDDSKPEEEREVVERFYILGQKYKVGDKTNKRVFMMPVQGTEIDIDIDSGAISLVRPEGYYLMTEMTAEEHASRIPKGEILQTPEGKPADKADI